MQQQQQQQQFQYFYAVNDCKFVSTMCTQVWKIKSQHITDGAMKLKIQELCVNTKYSQIKTPKLNTRDLCTTI